MYFKKVTKVGLEEARSRERKKRARGAETVRSGGRRRSKRGAGPEERRGEGGRRRGGRVRKRRNGRNAGRRSGTQTRVRVGVWSARPWETGWVRAAGGHVGDHRLPVLWGSG